MNKLKKLKKLLSLDARRDGLLPTASHALPFRIDPPGAREAFLICHGYTGIPDEMRHLATVLAGAGYAVSVPRYPGHGTCREDLFHCGAEDWLRCALDAYANLSAEYPVVHIAGHSMGGLIATAIAAIHGSSRLVLMAPAFSLSIPRIQWIPFTSHFVRDIKRNRQPSDFDRSNPARMQIFAQYWQDDLVAPTAGLVYLSRLVRGLLPRVKARVLVLLGEKDTTVPVSVRSIIEGKAVNAAQVETVVFDNAGHLFPFDGDRDRSSAVVLRWLADSASNPA